MKRRLEQICMLISVLAGLSCASPDAAEHTGQTTQAWTVGTGNTDTGPYSVAIGYSNSAEQTFSIAIGAYNRSRGAASVAIGEELDVSGDNSVALGYANTVPGTYAAAIGVSNFATETGSVALGIRSTASRPGELAHASGVYASVGLRAIDLYVESADGSPKALLNSAGGELVLSAASLNSMRIRLSVATTDGTYRHTHEVREVLVHVTTAYQVTLEQDEHVAGDLTRLGMSFTVIPEPSNVVRLQVDPGGTPARFLARVEWSDMGGLY